MLFFFFSKTEQEDKTGLVWEAGTSVCGEDIRKGCRR
jgi:hypothetical protein